jgi:hypothetical protein
MAGKVLLCYGLGIRGNACGVSIVITTINIQDIKARAISA